MKRAFDVDDVVLVGDQGDGTVGKRGKVTRIIGSSRVEVEYTHEFNPTKQVVGVEHVVRALDVEAATLAFLQTAFECETDESDDSGGLPIDDNYVLDDLDEAARKEAESDVASFCDTYDVALLAWENGISAEDIGINFYLSRNRHGTGFWDRGYGKAGEALHERAKVHGTYGLMAGDDGKVYHHG